MLVVGLDETACTLQEMGAAPDECVCSKKKMLIVSDGDVAAAVHR